jgi:CO/xanthine dehydrogenase Mo-binding subunit
MAKRKGRGIATIEYPTGMNQNGDPSQAWVKLKPDGRVDVFSGTVDIGQGSRTVHTQIVADTLGVPVRIPAVKESTALGAAIYAGVGAGLYSDASSTAADLVRFERTFEPQPAAVAAYDSLYEKWLELYRRSLELSEAGLVRPLWRAAGT